MIPFLWPRVYRLHIMPSMYLSVSAMLMLLSWPLLCHFPHVYHRELVHFGVYYQVLKPFSSNSVICFEGLWAVGLGNCSSIVY
ncbi:hypothetical protein BKA70DRAFT_1280560 [Coprinopsis sp. MPI-PUGE-AT-0042]|nr:hypothetical protein BKA70DRAFT_1280560 [Coprinopsis sp. MPI-PUGE-AT-0042]